MDFDIVIAGGGFAGAYCARRLGAHFGPEAGPRRVALIAERNVLVFQPMLAEVAGSTLGPADVVNPLRQFCRNVTVLQGSVQKIDWGRRELIVDGGRFTRNQMMGFRQLVLALGNVANLSMLPGMMEYGWPLKYVPDALRLRAALIDRLEEANLADDPKVRAPLLTFVVVGGGFTGVEAAGQLLGLVRQARKFYPALASTRIRFVLAHGGPELLPEIGRSLGGYARRALERRGVEVRLNTLVSAITASQVHLSDGNRIDAHTVVTTVGSSPNPVAVELTRELGLAHQKGRIQVEPTLQVAGEKGLWAIGDCAAVPWVDRGSIKTCPPTAQFAVRQGRKLADNLFRISKGGAARPFRYRYMGQLAAIGEREAVAEVMGFHFRGFFAWWLWRTIYLAKLPGVGRRLRVVIDWTFDLFFPRDIGILLPPPDEVLRPAHLEKGELLFAKGSPCRTIFYVRSGAVSFGEPGADGRRFPAGGIIGHEQADPDGFWLANASATEPTDLIVFRSRAFQLLRRELKLVARPRP
ncbi:MAG: FAD-dependent oxidoreductase [Opitutaceae bacterium]